MRKEITDFDRYLQTLHTVHSPILAKIEAELKADGKWGINIGSVEGLILQWMIKSMQIKSILEIGTQYGYSTQWMLEALPAEGKITSLEKDPDHHTKATSLITDPRAQFLLGDARELLASLEPKGSFDMVFIDANKKAYPDYLQWGKKHLRSGGLMVADNTFLFGHALKDPCPAEADPGLWKAMRQFNQNVFADPDFTPCILPTPDGLTLALKK